MSQERPPWTPSRAQSWSGNAQGSWEGLREGETKKQEGRQKPEEDLQTAPILPRQPRFDMLSSLAVLTRSFVFRLSTRCAAVPMQHVNSTLDENDENVPCGMCPPAYCNSVNIGVIMNNIARHHSGMSQSSDMSKPVHHYPSKAP